MTTTITDPTEQALWGTMPGWGIAVDLMPPEVGAHRRMRSMRRQVAGGFVLVVLLSVAGIVFSMLAVQAAQSDLDREQAQSAALQADRARFADVIEMNGQIATIDGQVAELMKTDTDVATLLRTLRSELPGTMSLATVNVTLGGDVAGAVAATPGEEPTIGTVTVGGSSRELSDLAAYVAELEQQEGVTDLVPNSNGVLGGRGTWTITFQLTEDLYTHRYDAATTTDGAQ